MSYYQYRISLLLVLYISITSIVHLYYQYRISLLLVSYISITSIVYLYYQYRISLLLVSYISITSIVYLYYQYRMYISSLDLRSHQQCLALATITSEVCRAIPELIIKTSLQMMSFVGPLYSIELAIRIPQIQLVLLHTLTYTSKLTASAGVENETLRQKR